MMDVLGNKRFQSSCAVVVLCLASAISSTSKSGSVSVQGVVVAIQRGETDGRLIEPDSFADLAEIYMVRADRWSVPRKEKYVLIEYVHHTGLIPYAEFDKTHWKFEPHQYSAEENRDCLSWMAREGLTFMPTVFGAQVKLPDPKTLSCFLMVKRPTAAR